MLNINDLNIEDRITFFENIVSTHKYIKQNYKSYKNGSIILADKQTGAIGTKGHSWYTGKNNIALSILYKLDCNILQLNGLTIKVAEILQKVLKKICNLNTEIKLPNDLVVNGKKISGILVEMSSIGEKINYLIISVGLNVNEDKFPEDLAYIATSLKIECGREFNREFIIKEFIYELENEVSYLRL